MDLSQQARRNVKIRQAALFQQEESVNSAVFDITQWRRALGCSLSQKTPDKRKVLLLPGQSGVTTFRQTEISRVCITGPAQSPPPRAQSLTLRFPQGAAGYCPPAISYKACADTNGQAAVSP